MGQGSICGSNNKHNQNKYDDIQKIQPDKAKKIQNMKIYIDDLVKILIQGRPHGRNLFMDIGKTVKENLTVKILNSGLKLKKVIEEPTIGILNGINKKTKIEVYELDINVNEEVKAEFKESLEETMNSLLYSQMDKSISEIMNKPMAKQDLKQTEKIINKLIRSTSSVPIKNKSPVVF